MTATTIKTTSRTTATTPTPTGPGKPSPTQNGLISSCTTFYKANQGDSCWAIANVIYPNTFTLDEFVSWNPAVGSDCMGLRAGYYYCIGVPGSPAVTLAPTSKPTATATATRCTASAPASTQPGALCGCKKWHKVSDGDVCYSIEQQYGISADDFLKWNPNVGSACGTLWLGYNVCVGM
jgi:LysM repeat protein